MSKEMPLERAAEILDPAHRESYESIEQVNEACRMGREAILLKIPRSPTGRRQEYSGLSQLRERRISAQYRHGPERILRPVRTGYFVGGRR